MNKPFLKKIFSLKTGQLLLIGLLSLSACEDKPVQLSGNILPEGEIIRGLNYDGHELISTNIARNEPGDDPVKTSDATFGIIGVFNDTVFGKTTADFVTDFSIGGLVSFSSINIVNGTDVDTVDFYKFNNNDPKYEDVWKVDSLVLNLQYTFNAWYGDMMHEQNIQVYELSSSLGSNATDYYNNSEVAIYQPAVGSKMVHPNNDVPDSLKSSNWINLWADADSLISYPQYLWDFTKTNAAIDSGYIDETASTSSTKYWRIKLSDELATRIFNADSASLVNTDAFKSLFNGLYVSTDKTTDEEGNLTMINLLASSSGSLASYMSIHLSRDHKYINDEDETRDTTSLYTYNFPINKENVRFNKYEHEIDPRIQINDPSTNSLYVQGMAGVYSRFSLPDEVRFWADSLSNIEDDPWRIENHYQTVANIEFYLEVDTTSNVSWENGGVQRYPIPQNLEVKWLDDKGNLVEPIYTTVIDGYSYSTPVFGSDADVSGSRTGTGELVVRLADTDDGSTRYEYLYRFIMRADYFNFIMRELAQQRMDEDLNEEEYLELFNEVFQNDFFIGPTSTTSNFQRVKLYSGSHPTKPFKMNIKYYHYAPR